MSAVSAPLPASAQEILPVMSKEALQSMGRAWHLDIKSRSKEVLVTLLAARVADPGRIEAALRSLGQRERVALDLVILNGGRLSAHALRGQLEAQGVVDPRPAEGRFWYGHHYRAGSPAHVDSRTFEDILARLGALGLAFPWPPPASSGMLNLKQPGDLVIIPGAILDLLPSVAVTFPSVPTPQHLRAASPDTVLRDVVTVLGAIRRVPIELTVRGLIPKRALVRLARALSANEGDLGYPTYLTSLARGAGLLLSAGGRLQEGSHTESFLERPRGERLRRLYEAYAGDERWSELKRIPGVDVRGNVEGPSIVRGRRKLLDVLSRVPAGRWIEIEAAVELVRRAAYEFLIPRVRHDPYGYFRDYPLNPYSGDNLVGLTFGAAWDESEGWSRIEGGFVRVMLTEPLRWLGVIDLGAGSPESEPHVFRVNEVGAALLQGRIPALAQSVTNVVVQPNFQVFAFEPTGEEVLFQLDRLADRVGALQAREYRITRDSVYRAQQSGMGPEAILAFLGQVSSVPVPQNVRRSIEEWAAQNDRIVVRRGASLLQTLDETVLDALYGRDDIAPLLGRRLAPTAALVAYSNLAELNHRLAGATGPMPALSEGNDAQMGNAIQVGDDGTITFRGHLPSIHVEREIRAIAERDGGGSYRLTRASLRRAAKRFGPDDIARDLAHLQGAPLSEHVKTLIQRWTKHWGTAALEEVTLLQVDSADILESLLAAPELRPYLQRLQGSATSALVRTEGLDIVRQALEERGMELRSVHSTPRKD